MNPQIQLMLQQAIQAFQGGNFDSADSILKRVLKVDSKNLPALHILGLIKISQLNYRDAADYLARAARIQPNDASIQYNLAKALSDYGNDQEALAHHKKAVALAPNNPDAWLSYGKSASNLGRYEDALVCYDHASILKPDYAEALLNKGATFKRLGRYEEAIDFAEQALKKNPALVEAWSNKGVALNELKHFDEAIFHFDKALSLKPDYFEAWSNKGVALNELKHFDEAIFHFDKALSLKPDYFEAWSNKGVALNELKHFDEAIFHFDKALSLKPDYFEAWSNKGVALNELKHFDEAIVHFDKALSLKPDFAEGWSNKGVALDQLKRFDEAIFHYKNALVLKPHISSIYGDLLHAKMKACSWSDFDGLLQKIISKISINEKVISPFPLLALSDDALLHKKCTEIYVQNRFHMNDVLGYIPKHSRQEKIRIGYFSSDFSNHPVSILTAELFELHDQDRFETFAFSLGFDDKSPIRHRLNRAFNHFIDVSDLQDRDIAKLSRELMVDIAVDLGGHTAGSPLGAFSYRVAPIQISYVGYLGTLGTDFVDYLIADKVVIPDESKYFYSEKIAYLPSYQVNDRKRVISEKKFTRAELGLPEQGFVFCCFNNNYKILPSTFESWTRVLKAVEGSVLFLYAENQLVEKNLKSEAEARGINPSRLVFGKRVPTDEYLARYRACDLFLDTYPYNAGTTASDALWAGLPVLTRIGQSFAGRMAASLLNAIGLPEMVAKTVVEYEALAIEIATNPEKLEKIKKKLIANIPTAPLFDTPLFAKNLEDIYMKMYDRYLADLQPEHIFLS